MNNPGLDGEWRAAILGSIGVFGATVGRKSTKVTPIEQAHAILIQYAKNNH